jgi:hypothetical protein
LEEAIPHAAVVRAVQGYQAYRRDIEQSARNQGLQRGDDLMRNHVLAVITMVGVACAAPVAAQIRYEVGGAVKSVSVQGTDVEVEIDLMILDEHGNKVPGFQSTPGINNLRTIEVRAYLCTANGICSFEKMTNAVGQIDGIDAYGITARIPTNSTPYPGIYLMQGARRVFWVSVRETQRDLSNIGVVRFKVLGQGSTIVSASGN